MRRWPLAVLLAATACAHPSLPPGPSPQGIAQLERTFQTLRYWDDQRRLMDSRGGDSTFHPATVAVAESLTTSRRRTALAFESVAGQPLDADDSAALHAMREAWRGGLSGDSTAGDSTADHGPAKVLADSLIDRYGRAAELIVVDGDTLNRLAILGKLGTTGDRERRERLFRALEPVWQSVNGDDAPDSPFRRLVSLRLAAWADRSSPVDAKGPAFGLQSAELETWLVLALKRWRATMPDTLLEPWDWYYLTGLMSRRLSRRAPTVADIRRVNDGYYRAMGADPTRLRIHYDLDPRPGKYPVAFTDFGVRNRIIDGRRVAGDPWVFASYQSGGIDNLAELLHESGHAIDIAAIWTRPAYLDWPDNDTFTEAIADLPAMELYEPGWQQRFLGDSVPLATALRAKYAGIVFDMAWALFEIRLYHAPGQDPNLVWTSITRDYLGIRPHPEWSWWAMRGQLLDGPGYLVNYALGAYLVADLRAAITRARGAQAWVDPGMYAWLSAHLYRFGAARPSRTVLESLLGRPLRPDALLKDLARVAP
ncbi:MAG TPA: hypothetical protein VMG41_09930 [Gemmatimonadales bacterium]|nr:hypothetical protein [Gemmatimonadales bacterium]